MTNFMEALSDEYICGKVKVRDDNVETNPNIIIKTEDCTDLGETSSISVHGLKREEKVIELKSKTCFIMKAFDKHCYVFGSVLYIILKSILETIVFDREQIMSIKFCQDFIKHQRNIISIEVINFWKQSG